MPGLDIHPDLAYARALAANGDYAASRNAYLRLLAGDGANVDALVELGALAQADGFQSAARSAFQQALCIAPCHPLALTGLGNALEEAEDLAAAKACFAQALDAAPDLIPAHQGLARCLLALGEAGAEPHLAAGFAGRAILPPRHVAPGARRLLLLVSARGGNVPCGSWVERKAFAVTTVIPEFLAAGVPLPPHDLVLNAMGDAECCAAGLDAARRMLTQTDVRVINSPKNVLRTGRERNATRLAGIPGLRVPRTVRVRRDDLLSGWDRFPFLLRSPGFHTGRHFVMVDSRDDLVPVLDKLPGDALLAIDYHDARGADGYARKYRVMFIGGAMYPLHLAAGPHWKVHYYTSCMAENATLRDEESRFLDDMPRALGPRAVAALRALEVALGLDYAGADFALHPDGSVILFEANATMIIHPPDMQPIWDYRRPAVAAALDAARNLLKKPVS
jgi:glutathione synthase/RimK-type ligase-like ATP-grasp enzyme